MSLPQLPYNASIMRSSPQTKFGGLNHNAAAGDGEIYDMTNLSAREFPLLTNRGKRGSELQTTITTPNGIGALDKPWWVDGTSFYYDGTVVSGLALTSGEKEFAAMGTKILIFPDKKYYDTSNGSYGSMESSAEDLTGVQFMNGSYAGVIADANTIYLSGANWASHFKVGDAVTISGCTTHEENNKTAIIREIDGDYLRFYENTFTLTPNWKYIVGQDGDPLHEWQYYWFKAGDTAKKFRYLIQPKQKEGDYVHWDGTTLTITYSGGTSTTVQTSDADGYGIELPLSEYGINYTEAGTNGKIKITRSVPNLEHVCVNENRLWGTNGKQIYASKLGDPFNFGVFDGLSTDSWQSETVDAGDFTACVSYLGYPTFFKENAVYKVYGDKPSNFQWTPSARLGVKKNCEKSLAVAGETLFYLSPAGICAYTGGIPSVISGPLGENKTWSYAAAGSDNLRYYVSMTDGTAYSLFVYDTRYRTWHREDATQAIGFAYWNGGLHMLAKDSSNKGQIWRIDGSAGTLESTVSWIAEFADFTRVYETTDTGSENKKGLLRLLIRCELGTNASMSVLVRYDSRGDWITAKTITTETKKSFIVPLILRRNDHFRMKLTGTGDFKVWSIAPVRYSGSHLQ